MWAIYCSYKWPLKYNGNWKVERRKTAIFSSGILQFFDCKLFQPTTVTSQQKTWNTWSTLKQLSKKDSGCIPLYRSLGEEWKTTLSLVRTVCVCTLCVCDVALGKHLLGVGLGHNSQYIRVRRVLTYSHLIRDYTQRMLLDPFSPSSLIHDPHCS